MALVAVLGMLAAGCGSRLTDDEIAVYAGQAGRGRRRHRGRVGEPTARREADDDHRDGRDQRDRHGGRRRGGRRPRAVRRRGRRGLPRRRAWDGHRCGATGGGDGSGGMTVPAHPTDGGPGARRRHPRGPGRRQRGRDRRRRDRRLHHDLQRRRPHRGRPGAVPGRQGGHAGLLRVLHRDRGNRLRPADQVRLPGHAAVQQRQPRRLPRRLRAGLRGGGLDVGLRGGCGRAHRGMRDPRPAQHPHQQGPAGIRGSPSAPTRCGPARCR